MQAHNDSMYNTPRTFAWYAAALVFEWLKELGGIKVIAKQNEQKSQLLYQAIDQSDFYSNNIAPRYRSWMNVPFFLADAQLDAQFVKSASDAGLLVLKGQKAVGGMRASIYNAMELNGVEALVGFMEEFERTQA